MAAPQLDNPKYTVCQHGTLTPAQAHQGGTPVPEQAARLRFRGAGGKYRWFSIPQVGTRADLVSGSQKAAR